MTPVRLVLQEFLDKVLHIVQVVILVWADEAFNVDTLAGSSDFQAGAAFGKAAVDSLAGEGAWERDFLNSERSREMRLEHATGQVFGEENALD